MKILSSSGAVAIALSAAVAATSIDAAHAEPLAAEIVMTCPETGPAVVICAAVGVVLHEMVQMLNGNDAFGPNGAIMRVLSTPIEIVGDNLSAAADEPGSIAQLVRAVVGISWDDILKYGIFGGPNSFFRKPLG